MMKLHWSPKSPYVRKVMVCAIELGLEGQIDKVRSVAAMLAPNPAIRSGGGFGCAHSPSYSPW